ncbi:unnamed protein product [Lupinus luteus]|uniref:Uncharacterized protein n=1 Tax=Lupinus luteus TaxID=3873 RepID=A0AAV1WPI4_LUPLU
MDLLLSSTGGSYDAQCIDNVGDTNEEYLDNCIDEQVGQAKQASLNSQYEWEQRQHFRQQTRGYGNIYEQGGSSHASGSDFSRPQDIDFNLRSTDVDLVRSRSTKKRIE